MKYFDAFSGYGGFSLGIQQAYVSNQQSTEIEQDGEGRNRNLDQVESDVLSAGRTAPLCIGYSEIDKYAVQIYEKHFPEHKNYGDITKINASELPDFDLFVGGFPCQAFSIAGKRAGFEDTRGTLIYDVLRIVKEKHPRLVLLENVKGLLSHDGGRTFKTIISSLAELGYAVEWQVLNAKNFGVPQNRERVFIIGHLGGFGGRQVFPIGEGSQGNPQSDGQGNAYCLQAGGDKHRGTYIQQLNNPTHSNNRLYGEEGISPALNTAQGGNRQPKIPSDSRIRRLTPLEAERLMGLPDGWTEKGLSYIMEICVNTTTAIANQLLALDSVLCTTKDGKELAVQICQSKLKENASIVIAEPSLVDSVISTTNHSNDMVMLYNQKETLSIEELIKQRDTYEKTEGKSIYKIWRVSLDGNYEKEKLSTILTSIREITEKLTSTYAKTGESIIGVIIHLNSSEQSFLREESLVLKMASIESISDTQRYKLCGNGVVVNVVEEIIKQLV